MDIERCSKVPPEGFEPSHPVPRTGYPAKVGATDSADGKARLRATHRALAAAPGVLLLGAGPVGLKLAGEIKSV